MGNYYQLEIDFVRRTLDLIEQYEQLKDQFPFEQQFNHTLLTNCLLGLIVLPKEKALSYIPKTRIAFVKALAEWGINKSSFNPDIKDTVELFQRLRNARLEVKDSTPLISQGFSVYAPHKRQGWPQTGLLA